MSGRYIKWRCVFLMLMLITNRLLQNGVAETIQYCLTIQLVVHGWTTDTLAPFCQLMMVQSLSGATCGIHRFTLTHKNNNKSTCHT